MRIIFKYRQRPGAVPVRQGTYGRPVPHAAPAPANHGVRINTETRNGIGTAVVPKQVYW